jgi:hypothetical protein
MAWRSRHEGGQNMQYATPLGEHDAPPRLIARLTCRLATEGGIEHAHRVRHGQDSPHIVLAQDQCHAALLIDNNQLPPFCPA